MRAINDKATMNLFISSSIIIKEECASVRPSVRVFEPTNRQTQSI